MMGKLLAAAVGFCSLMPGVAIVTLGGVGAQPIVIVLLAYVSLLPVLNLQLPIQSLIWILLTLVTYAASTLFSVSPQTSAMFSMMQGIYLALGAIGFSAILCNTSHRQEFVRGYIVGALLSSVVSFGQMAYAAAFGGAMSFANNTNFSIVPIYDRGAAFTPESSALAALLIPAILCSWFERQAGAGLSAPWQRSWTALTVLALGLVSTKSSSLIYFPILLVLASAFQSGTFGEFSRGSVKLLIPVVIAGIVFLPLYSTRLATTDADSSVAWRLTKILTGFRIFEANPFVGAGTGLVSDSDYFEPFMDIPPDLQWNTDPRKGVDSTAVRVLAETGLVGFVVTYYPIIIFFRRARTLCKSPAFRAIVTMSLGLLFSQFFISGYRDQIIFLLPPIAFAVAGGVRAVATRSLWQRKADILSDTMLPPRRMRPWSP
jgi:O-antigen ligase